MITAALTRFCRPAAAAIAALVLLAGCSGHWMPSERTVYQRACEAIKALPGLPAGSLPQSIDQCRLYIGKSAARIDVPVAPAGGGSPQVYIVWLKRVARTWVVDRPATRATPDPALAAVEAP